ncbi:MAG TPA: TRAP transporter TatT component family protein [Bacteroidota bacterium]
MSVNFVYIAFVLRPPRGKNRTALRATSLILVLSLSGCSIQHLAIRSLTDVFENGFEVLNEESDLKLAEEAIGGDLKTLEGALRTDPENDRLLLLLTRGYSGYALGFVEDDDPARAREMYSRARDYGLLLLRRNKSFRESLKGSLEEFERALGTLDDIPAVFWTAMGWSSYINLSKDDPAAVAEMPRVVAMMRYVLARNENYYYGGAHLFFGVWFGNRPALLGGNPDSSRYHFDRCIEIGKGKFLLPYVYYARYYAVQVQESPLFRALLEKVLSAPLDVLPEQRLVNSISKRKAEKYLNEAEAYF